MTIALTPRRDLATLGTYVTFRKIVKGPDYYIPRGTRGMVVEDRDGRCKTGCVLVKVPGHLIPKVSVDMKHLEFDRPAR